MSLRWLIAMGLGSGLSGCGEASKPGTTDDASFVDLSRQPAAPAPLEATREPAAGVAATPASEAPPTTLAPRQPFSMPEQTSTTTSMPTIPGTSPLAGVCDRDSDCATGLRCFTMLGQVTDGTISIGRGYCSIACSEDTACAGRFGAGSVCDIPFYMGVSGYCTAPCSPGAAEADKCGGRRDVECFGSPGQPGSCNPLCESDADCGSARCELGSGQCRLGPAREVSPVGSGCSDDLPFCAGFCVGEATETRLCSGPCRLGSSCSGPANACVPADPSLRRGDFGLCERLCSTSADCTPGLTRCAPTGFLSNTGEPERTCAAVHPGPSFLNQRLSVEQLALLTKFPRLVAVAGFTATDTRFQLAGSSEGICITGTVNAAGEPAVLVLQLGSNDPVPFDASEFNSAVLDYTGDSPVRFEAQLANRPGTFYRSIAAAQPGRHSLPFSSLAGSNAGDPAWDPSQLEAIRLIVGSGAPGPFNVCVTELGFE